MVVNAAGPWVAEFLDRHTPTPAKHHPRMIRGSHIVVRKLYDHDYAYIFQAPDGRIVFAVPYEDEFTLIGTTESEYDGDLAHPAIADAEVRYLLDMVRRYFARELDTGDVVWTFAGLRPLLAASVDDPKSVTRDYVVDFDRSGAPLLSIYGGKLTTYRKLAQQVVDQLLPVLGRNASAWTAGVPLPGGDMPGGDFDAFAATLARRYPWLPPALRQRYARAYGTRVERLLGGQPLPWPTWARKSCRACTRARSSTCAGPSSRSRRTTSCSDAASLACTSGRTRSPCSMPGSIGNDRKPVGVQHPTPPIQPPPRSWSRAQVIRAQEPRESPRTLFERPRGDGASGWPDGWMPPRVCARTAALDKSRGRDWIVGAVCPDGSSTASARRSWRSARWASCRRAANDRPCAACQGGSGHSRKRIVGEER